MSTTGVDPRSIRDEGPWLERIDDLDDLVELRTWLLDNDVSRHKAACLTDWLVAKKAALPDIAAPTQRAEYRRILRELGPPPKRRRLGPPGGGGERRRRRRQGEDGAVGMRPLIAVAAGAATAAALGPVNPVAAIAAGLYVTRSPGEGEDLRVAA